MEAKNPMDVVLSFVDKINRKQVEEMCRLMPEDHVFIDSLGRVFRGREEMRASWVAYFAWFPDYQISIAEVLQRGSVVALFGMAGGTYSIGGRLLEKNRWQVPAAWRAVVRDGLVAEWQVYADNSPVLRIIQASNP